MPSESVRVKAFIASKSAPFGSFSSYGMMVVRSGSLDEYWGLQRASTVILEMQAAYRLLAAVEEANIAGAKVHLVTNSPLLRTRIIQTLNALQKVQAKQTIGYAQDRDQWFDAARLWESHRVGLVTAAESPEDDRIVFKKARQLARASCVRERATEELFDDGKELLID